MWELISLLFMCGLCINGQSIYNESSSSEGNRNDLRNVIVTSHGPVRGFEKDGVLQFFDIPYGAFNVDRPFQEPTEPSEWIAPREVDSHRSRCPQLNAEDTYVGDNQCLTLSIFKAYSVDDEHRENSHSATNADVLFHIHDSSFSYGSGDPNIYYPHNLVSKGIILVLPNYRLGPLGFLCLQNETAPGNAGLKDLTLALHWTMKNIESFGGNSSNIVVSGAGAGGALVEYLILSNMSRIYFSKAITESGSSLSPWALDRNPIDMANSLINTIKEDQNEESQIYSVFDYINLETLVRGASNLDFRPCIESEVGFLTETPWQILQKQSFSLDIMSGSANQAAMERALLHTEETLSLLNSNLSMLLPNDLNFENNEHREQTGRQVKALYFGEGRITCDEINLLSQCYTDSGYLNSGIRSARLLTKGGATVYFYEYAFTNPNIERAINGSARGDSLAFVFNNNNEQFKENEQLIRIKSTVTDIWVSFIRTGTPSTDNIVWNNLREVEVSEEEWLSIDTEIQIKKGLHVDRLSIWQEIYNKHFVENSSGVIYKRSISVLASSWLVRLALCTTGI